MSTVILISEARDLLRTWREDNERSSDDVVDLWEALLQDSASELGEEKWMILEQVSVAAMDCHRPDLVDACLRELKANFDSSSVRVRRLLAMRAEMNEDWDKAHAILDSILEEDDSNSQARKRKVAICVAQGDNVKAINELNKYIKDFMFDGEAWMELCDLYIIEQDYSKAAFCCEELILQNPHNHLYYQKLEFSDLLKAAVFIAGHFPFFRYAEIKYTQGGFEHMEMAKTYYCHTIKLNPDNMRALYGLLLVSGRLAFI